MLQNGIKCIKAIWSWDSILIEQGGEFPLKKHFDGIPLILRTALGHVGLYDV